MRGALTPGMPPTFAQVCSSRVTKEYRLPEFAIRVFVNPGVPILAFLVLDSSYFEARAEQPQGVDASLDEVYSESEVVEAAGAVPPAVKSS
jgi:hypothetical protein